MLARIKKESKPCKDSAANIVDGRFNGTGDCIPGGPSLIVDVNGESLGTTERRVALGERYRTSAALAGFDGGVRVLCAAGRRCTQATKCGFCIDGPLRPIPADGYQQFPSTVVQARGLWNFTVSIMLQELGIEFDAKIASAASLGAMLLAAHCQGHNCISAAFDGVFPCNVPHDVQSLSGVVSWAKACKFKPDVAIIADRNLMIVHFSESGIQNDITHVFAVPCDLCDTFSEVSVSSLALPAGLMVSVQVVTYQALFKTKQARFIVDTGYRNQLSNECISCNHMPLQYHYCRGCAFVVKSDGHSDRCRVADATATTDLILRRAQIGDVMHRTDVLLALMERGVPAVERTGLCVEYIQGPAQAAFMRFAGYNGPDGILSTWFEALYDYFRPYYWAVTFGVCPSIPVLSISIMQPMTLSSAALKTKHCAPDYAVVWDHVQKVEAGVKLCDDPITVAFSEFNTGNCAKAEFYLARYSPLPPVMQQSQRESAVSDDGRVKWCCWSGMF